MIPHKLQLKNFLSYGADFQTIDFTPYHLIYLSGKNGHGKSALLDAMTWAVWGIARKITNAVRADQGLLRLGQQQMAVIFDFEISGQMYRVKREFLVTQNKPLAQLEFGLLNAETDSYVPLTDKTIRATQAKIEQTIKLDFESFVNTAFLRQGNANEFSKKSPKDRKEVLGTILGLQQFDRLKKRALEKIKSLQGERTTMNALHESAAKQLAQKDELQKLFEVVKKEQEASDAHVKQLQTTSQTLSKEQGALAEQDKQREMHEYKQKQLQQARDAHVHSLRDVLAVWRKTNKKQRHMPDLKELEAAYKKSKELLQAHAEKFKQSIEFSNQLMHSTQALTGYKNDHEKKQLQEQQSIHIQKERLLLTQKNLQAVLAQLNKESVAAHDKKTSIEKLQEEQLKQILSKEKIAVMYAQFEKRKEQYHAFVAQRNMFASEQETLLKKQTMVGSDDSSCPLCEQNLSAARKKFLKNKCSKEARFALHQYNRLVRIAPKLKELLVAQHAYLEDQKKQSVEYEGAQKERTIVLEQIERLKKEKDSHAKQLQAIKKELDDFAKKELQQASDAQKKLEADAQYSTLFKAQKEFEEKIKTLSYKKEEHAAAQKEAERLEKERDGLLHLQQELVKQSDRKEAIAKEIVQLKLIKKELIVITSELKTFDSVTAQKKALQEKLQLHEAQMSEHAKARETIREKQGALLNKKEHLEKVEKESADQLKVIKEIDVQISDYQEIAQAAGKDGIQALLIEDAIPEIEQEANFLLSRLTHNQSHVSIESLRDLKRGGTKETLDINISDPSGIRPYELFSGGEAFRIDFALRIAISKLLARRAGTALQTLIIDEGFGSQDEEGLSLIMDVIQKVQDDFQKVIVVSHLPGMREQFPVHFTVEKKPSGSCVNVVELG